MDEILLISCKTQNNQSYTCIGIIQYIVFSIFLIDILQQIFTYKMKNILDKSEVFSLY